MTPCGLTQECPSCREHDAPQVRLVWRQQRPLKPRRNSYKLQRATHVEAAASHKTLAHFYQTTRRHNPEDNNGHSLSCENPRCVEMVTNGRRPFVAWPQASKSQAVKEDLINVRTKRRLLRNKFSNCVSESTWNKFDCRFSAECTQLSTTEFRERCSNVRKRWRRPNDNYMTSGKECGEGKYFRGK